MILSNLTINYHYLPLPLSPLTIFHKINTGEIRTKPITKRPKNFSAEFFIIAQSIRNIIYKRGRVIGACGGKLPSVRNTILIINHDAGAPLPI